MGEKPIKRNKNIAKLSRDHHASLMFCWKLRHGIKFQILPERMINYVTYFTTNHLNPHFKEEEEILFAPLKDDKVQRAINEHVLIKNIIQKIPDLSQENQIKELAALADLVDAHVRYEERILFPHLEKELTEEQLENIGKIIKDDPLKDNYPDDFWVKKPNS
jgi:iron-sulfur cluster repair protein YtfE (RIC family)